MANSYFSPTTYTVIDGTTIDAVDFNNPLNALEVSFDAVETDVTNIKNSTIFAGTAAEGYVPSYNATTGLLEMRNIAAVVGSDTYKVKLDAADTEQYLLLQLQYLGVI